MVKDNRYEVVKAMIEIGKIVEFSQIFDYIPIRVVADDLKSSSRRISKLKEKLNKLELEEIDGLSELIGVPMKVIYELSEQQYLSNKLKATKRENKVIN